MERPSWEEVTNFSNLFLIPYFFLELSRRALISLIYLQTLNYSLTFVSHNNVETVFGKFI